MSEQLSYHLEALNELGKTKAYLSLLGLLSIGGGYFASSTQDVTYQSLITCAEKTTIWIADGLDRDSISNLQEAFKDISDDWKR